MMVELKNKPSELLKLLFEKVGAHYYDRIDTQFKGNREEKEKRILDAHAKTIGGLKVLDLITSELLNQKIQENFYLNIF